MNHIGACLRESAYLYSHPIKHGILAKWNANSDSTAKVMLIKHGQLGLIAHKKQMVNHKKPRLLAPDAAQNFNASAHVSQPHQQMN